MLETFVQSSEPLFISFEGGEGSGKSTQIKLFCEALEAAGAKVHQTREPGGCEQAELLRKMLVEGDADRWDGVSEAFLYSAARREHLRQTVRPNLEAGTWVVTDRFADSTTVYQGEGRGIERADLLKLHELATGGLWPHLTIILDIPVEEGLKRASARTETAHETRFEGIETAFHERVRSGFLKIAEENPSRCRVISALGSVEEVRAGVKEVLLKYLEETTKAA